MFEKMTTGVGLGELVRNILIYLVDQDVLFHGESSTTLNRMHSFDVSYMYVCEVDDSQNLEDTRIILNDMMNIQHCTLGDREVVKYVCQLVGTRAAMLVGSAIAAVVRHVMEQDNGFNTEQEGCAIGKESGLYTIVCIPIMDDLL